jgi:hypothetical protein
MAAPPSDTGTVAVNMDDAILSGKVTFNTKESILLLTATQLICREFAGQRDSTSRRARRPSAPLSPSRPVVWVCPCTCLFVLVSLPLSICLCLCLSLALSLCVYVCVGVAAAFVLPLDQLVLLQEDRANPCGLVVVGTFPHPQNRGVGVQHTLHLGCSERQEAFEWIETIQAVLTDRNIRSANAQEEACSPRSTHMPSHRIATRGANGAGLTAACGGVPYAYAIGARATGGSADERHG